MPKTSKRIRKGVLRGKKEAKGIAKSIKTGILKGKKELEGIAKSRKRKR